MAFPSNIIYGPDSARWETDTAVTVAASKHPIGSQLVLADGRKFRWVRVGATALTVGNLLQAPANTANHVNLATYATPINSMTITVAVGATAVTANEYADGYATISVTPGAGLSYRILSHPANAGSLDMVVTLAPGNAVQTALTTVSRVDLIRNSYYAVIQAPVTTLTREIVGVAQTAVVINGFGWVQTRGPCAVLTSGTVILGNQVVAEIAAGAVGPTAVDTRFPLGMIMRVAADAAWSTVYLTLDG